MAKNYLAMAQDLSLQELKRLLAVKQQLEKLARKRDELQKELARVEKEIAALGGRAPSGKKTGAGKKTRKKTTRRKAARKTVKKAVKKTVKKAVKKTARKTARKAAGKVARKTTRKVTAAGRTTRTRKKVTRAGGRPRLEDVIADLISRHGGTMTVKDILTAFREGKLFPTRSKNFENVLRRTLSTSKKIARAGRGIYKLAG